MLPVSLPPERYFFQNGAKENLKMTDVICVVVLENNGVAGHLSCGARERARFFSIVKKGLSIFF